MIAADFGSGSGGWVIPLAKELEEGRVYAIDILQEPLSALRSRGQHEKVLNIQTVRADIENKGVIAIPDGFIDLVLMTNFLFQIGNKKNVFAEAKRILKKGGKVLVVDWKEEASLGPEEGRVSENEVKKLAEETGLALGSEFEAGLHHYGLIFEKKPAKN